MFQSVWLDQYRRHNAAVKALVPPSQLLVYRVGEGWDRLCHFLEAEIPAVPFPHENKAGQAGNIVEKYHRFDVYLETHREVRRSLVKVCLSLSLTILGGVCLRKYLKI